MKDAASCSGAFYGFSEPERDQKLRALGDVIGRYQPKVIHCSVATDSFVQTRRLREQTEPRWRLMRNPYIWAFQRLVIAIAQTLHSERIAEPCEIIFDQNEIFHRKAKVVFRLRESFPNRYVAFYRMISPRGTTRSLRRYKRLIFSRG